MLIHPLNYADNAYAYQKVKNKESITRILSGKNCPELVDKDLPTLLNTGTSMAIPNDIENLYNFIRVQETSIRLAKVLLNKPDLPGAFYTKIFPQAQKMAEILLDAELKFGQQLKTLPTAQGKRTDLQLDATDKNRSKKELLKDLGISERKAFDLQKLTPEAVEKAKRNAKDNGEIATRKMALTLVKKEHFKRNNIKTSFDGIFDDNERPSVDSFTDKQPLYYTQCFSSIGVGEEKLEQIGLYPTVANEAEKDRCKWYKERHPNCQVIEGKIDNPEIFEQIVAAHLKNNNKLILASPPCPDYSIAGKHDFDNPRAKLVFKVLELAQRVNEINTHILIENVPGFLTAAPENWPELQNGTERMNLGTYVKCELEKLGYTVNIAVVYGCDYNTAQKRKRAFILASKNGLWKFPKKDLQWKTLMDVIAWLPPLNTLGQKSPYKWHEFPKGINQETIKVLQNTPTGHSAQDNDEEFLPKNKDGSRSRAKFKSYNMRNCWGYPASTIMQHNDNPGGHRTIHPGRPLATGKWTDPRTFSILELILITGLDENYFIPNWATEELIRNSLGDCLLPNVNLALCSMIPGRK